MAFTGMAGTSDSRAGNTIAGYFPLVQRLSVWEVETTANFVGLRRRRHTRDERFNTVVSPVELTPIAPEVTQWWTVAALQLPPPRRRKLPRECEFTQAQDWFTDFAIALLITRQLEGGYHRGGPI